MFLNLLFVSNLSKTVAASVAAQDKKCSDLSKDNEQHKLQLVEREADLNALESNVETLAIEREVLIGMVCFP